MADDRPPSTVTVTLPQLAKLLDHALLHPTLTDADVLAGLAVAARCRVAAACVKPHSVPAAADALAGSGVLVAAVVGFPHGSATTAAKAFEADRAVRDGAHEVDVVVNVGKVRGADWEYVTNEIRAVADAVAHASSSPAAATASPPATATATATASSASPVGIGAAAFAAASGSSGLGASPAGGDRPHDGPRAVKVIFETGYLDDEQIAHLCRICTALSVGFVKTSTGFGFARRQQQQQQQHGSSSSSSPSPSPSSSPPRWEAGGATEHHLRLMRANVGPGTRIKASGGIRSLDDLLRCVALGVARVGTSASEALLREAADRGINHTPTIVEVKPGPLGGEPSEY